MKRSLIALLGALLVATLAVPIAAAHPLGNFSVNRYSRLEVGPERVELQYVLDLAEIPTLQELRAAGVEGTTLDEPTRAWLLAAKTAALVAGAQLELGGRPVTWTVEDASLELLPGQADLPTMRVALTLRAPVRGGDGVPLAYRDANYPGRVGWHEVVLRGVGGVIVAGSSVPSADQTDELRQYPEDQTRAPLDVSAASASLSLGPGRAAEAPWSSTAAQPSGGAARFAVDGTADQLTGLLRSGAWYNPLSLLAMLAVAAGLGAIHALGPGHGKTVVGAYLVGSRGTAYHAALLGLTVTITHTLGVYALGLVTLVAAQYVLPERLYPILGVVSGLLVVGIGLALVRARLGAAFGSQAGGAHHHDHGPGHAHLDHHHEHGPDHAHGQHQHDHDHLPGHDHDHTPAPAHARTASELPAGRHASRPAVHSHAGGKPHSHVMPGADGQPVTLKSLLALGVSGGLLPCPSALVVLLAAISFHNVLLGMVLVAAFSVGLAGVLTGIGLLMVYGGRWLGRTSLAGRLGGSPLARAVPALSALAITAAGLLITVQAARTLL